MPYTPEDLGAVCGFKYPDEVKRGKILIQKDNTQHDPYIKKWQVQDPYPTQADLDLWWDEWQAALAQDSADQADRDAAEARLRAPYGITTSVPQLREMVDDIVTYLGLDS